ncbi:MAG: cation transporter [Campylobacterota bacterium]|nr:cation transporter [Campylobacterota bacterium]
MLETLELHNLSCGGCAATIRTALDIAGFKSVRVNLLTTPHSVTAEVEGEKQMELLKSVLRDHGYPPLSDHVDVVQEPVEHNFS